MIKNKKQMLLVITIFTLLLTLGSVTYAFFNYTRTGAANTLKVGRIAFNSTQNNTISLENVFPTSSTNLNSSNSDTVTINITGDTTYSEGIEYKVTLEDVNNTINGKEVPISFNVTANNLGTKDTSYYTNRGGENPIYNLTETGQVEDGKYILVGYIPSGEDGVNGSVDVTAFIDASNVAISDTVSRIEDGNFIYGETPGDWIAGRTVFTTSEWNSLSTNGISFKVRVEANEGIWVEEEKYFVMKNLVVDSNWTSIRANITSIEFHKDGVALANPLSSFDATDVMSKGTVSVYTVDDGLGNNTYKAIVVADDVIYAPESSIGLFAGLSMLKNFNSNNFKVDNVTNMANMFNQCTNLTDINFLSQWNTSNVTNMTSMFQNCTNLTDISGLINWNVSSVENMQQLFNNCSYLADIKGLINWNVYSVENISGMFYGCTNLTDISGLLNWNVSSVTTLTAMFRNCTNLRNISALSNWATKTRKVENMGNMFYGCTNLTDISGLSNWDVSSVTIMTNMFRDCTNLTDISALANWNTSSVINMNFMFGMAGSGTTKTGDPVIDFSALSNWDVSSVTSMASMFQNVSILSYQTFTNWNVGKVQSFSNMFNQTGASTVTTLDGLENWNVSSATNMTAMFQDNVSLTDASAINNWNIKSSITFTDMFHTTPVHPEFTKFPNGTWDSNGTFTPNA